MDSIQNTVYYCCIVKEDQIMYTYSNGNSEIESLAELCLEKMIPPFHKWYFQTMNQKIFGFFKEDKFVYFAILDESLGNSGVYKFLKTVNDEFRKAIQNSSRRNMTDLNALALQEQFLPVIHRLIVSLDKTANFSMEMPMMALTNLSVKTVKERLVVEETGKDCERGEVLRRAITGNEIGRRKWCREIRIVIAIDVGVCLVLLAVWLIICSGVKCTR
ncbi:phytolongin Phyl1.1-like [Impatiens glandulifera]|uniref:phytolongin Phyl1.1-like n=1 Tax=Impatiens glandulifera TaxID=253017 RepID=UPI001FB11BF5|nr:phytolongin Phyl1.1-like [Impatiens glandulifera]